MMTNLVGIHLPTQLPLLGNELAQILSLGADHYLCYLTVDDALTWKPILQAIKNARPSAQIHVRIEARGTLDADADATAIDQVMTALPGLRMTIRCRNEPNIESDCTPVEWNRYLKALDRLLVARHRPGVLFYTPAMSPGEPRYQAFVDTTFNVVSLSHSFTGRDVHAYGSPTQVLSIVQPYMRNGGGAVLLTEYNFGAGDQYDLDQYARDIPVVFEGLAQRNIPGCIFAWRWVEPDVNLPTTVDIAAMPQVQDAIKKLTHKKGAHVGDYPHAIWKGTPNFGYPNGTHGRNGHLPVAIVDHISEGTKDGIVGWFQNPASADSSTYYVTYDGEVWQFVLETDAQWTNGPFHNPDLTVPWIADAFAHGVNGNLVTVTIEHEGFTGQAMPEKQYEATLALHRDIIARHGWPAEHQRVCGHFQIDSVTRLHCPGSGFNWPRLRSDLGIP